MKTNSLLKNQNGLVTIDYLFAFVLTMGFVAILFAISMTLTVASITQYATFSAARGFSASHVNPAAQYDFANRKFGEVVGNAALAPLYNNGWFFLSEPLIGNLSAMRPELSAIEEKFGVGVQLTAAILDFEVPFFGPTDPESEDGQGKGFQTFISSYTGRESTMVECQQFIAQRWTLIKGMDQSHSNGQYSGDRYVPMEDNGC